MLPAVVRIALLWKALGRTSGAETLRRASPLYIGIAIVASILFGKNGMSAAEATAAVRGAPVALGLLWIVWTLPTTPLARVLLEARSSFALRALPVPRWHWVAVLASQLLILELPWIILWTRGEGLASGVVAALAAAGAHAILVAGVRRPTDVAAAAALVTSIAAPLPGMASIAIAGAGAMYGVATAFLRAPERDARARGAPLTGPPPVALARAYLLTIWRGEAATLWRGALLAAAGGGLTALAAGANDISPAGGLSLGVAAVTLAFACSAVASAVLRTERGDGWLLAVTATRGGALIGAAAGATAIWGALFACVHVVAATAVGGYQPLVVVRLLAGALPWGVVVAALVQVAHRWAMRSVRPGTDPSGRILIGMIGVILGGTISAGVLGEVAVPALAGATAVILAASAQRVALRGQGGAGRQ